MTLVPAMPKVGSSMMVTWTGVVYRALNDGVVSVLTIFYIADLGQGLVSPALNPIV